MASCITSQFGNSYCPQVRLTVEQQSQTETSATLSWKLEYVTHGYAATASGARDYSVTIAGSTVKSGTFDISGKSSTTIASGTKTITKTHSAQTISFGLSFNFNLTWNGTYSGSSPKTASSSISVSKKTSYTVAYNANGGTGTIASQTKWYGESLTLSSSVPTRTNYTFKGWGTSASSTTATYQKSGAYTKNAGVTLYAVWELAYKAPEITGLKVARYGNASGGYVADEAGTYAKVEFTFACSQLLGTNNAASASVTVGSASAPVSVSGASGSVSVFVGGNLSVDNSYGITVSVTDQMGGTTTRTVTLTSCKFVMDAKAGGTGVAFGKAADKDGVAEFGFPVLLSGDIMIKDMSKTYKPYYTAGDVINSMQIDTAGYLTSSKTSVRFTAPLTKPIIGASSVKVTTNDGFTLRQNAAYTHGSADGVGVTPSTIQAWVINGGLEIWAKFATTTNAVNNAPIGIISKVKVEFV